MKFTSIFLASLATFSFATPATATVYDVTYQGTVTSATNFEDPNFPDVPTFTAHVGELVTGMFSFDSSNIGDDGLTTTVFLDSISFALPAESFSEDFAGPGGVLYFDDLTGLTSIYGGRPDYGRQLSIQFDLPALQSFDPNDLYGKTGPFKFDAYGPGGFEVSGFITAGAVPEPATWAFMIGGFALVGYAMRRRPKVAVSAYAA